MNCLMFHYCVKSIVFIFATFVGTALHAQQSAKKPIFTRSEIAWIAAHPTINVVVNSDWHPLEYIEHGQHKGLTVDYLGQISRISGLQFHFINSANFSQATQQLLEQKVDLISALTPPFLPGNWQSKIQFSQPYFVGATVIIGPAAESIIFDLHKLDGKTVAICQDGIYDAVLVQNFPDLKLLKLPATADLLEAVANGNADAALGLNAGLIPPMQRHFKGTLQLAGTVTSLPLPVSFGIRSNQIELLAILNKSLDAITAKQANSMMNKWLEGINYGAPTWGSLLLYYRIEVLCLLSAIGLVLLLAYRAKTAQLAAQRSEQHKSRFLAMMSHEIRTPMNAILSALELIDRTTLDTRQKQLTQLAKDAAESLLNLLDDVLDLSKLESRHMELEFRATDINALAQQVVSLLQSKADEKNLALIIATKIRKNTSLMLEPTRLQQILLNLISNAIKFTESGQITIELSLNLLAIDTHETAAQLAIRIADTGIGISAEQQARLFQPFSQADVSTSRRYGGTGLGLAICRDLVNAMHGKLRLASEVGVGTTLFLTLPTQLAAAASKSLIEQEAPLTPVAHQPVQASVLVVDDHPSNLAVIEQQLHELGCDAVLASDGKAALDLIAQQTFSLVLLDCNMPELDGYTVARMIRQQQKRSELSKGRHLPIIAISAANDAEHTQRCLDSGMDGVLTKPLRLPALRQLIAAWCGVEPKPTAAPSFGSRASEVALALFKAESQRDWFSIQQALINSDFSALQRAIHRLKGAAYINQLHPLAQACVEIEQLIASKSSTTQIQSACTKLGESLQALV